MNHITRRPRRLTLPRLNLAQLAATLTLTTFQIALAAPKGGGTNNPIDVLKDGLCGENSLVGWITDPTIVGVAVVASIALGAWGGWLGNRQATKGIITGLVCAACILGASTIAGSFVKGCS